MKHNSLVQAVGACFCWCVVSFVFPRPAAGEGGGRVTVGECVGGGGLQVSDADSPNTEEQTLEGGLRVSVEAIVYDHMGGGVIMLWELRSVLRGFGGYAFGTPKVGYGGGEITLNGDIGITIFGILPVNFAVEDTQLRFTNRGLFGKTLLGTSHVIPLDVLINELFDAGKVDEGGYYLAVSHGFRYHAMSGWTWSVMPKFRFFSELIEVEARYLFGFWGDGRREHSGVLYIDVPIGKFVVSLWGGPEALELPAAHENIFGWRAMAEVSYVVAD